MGEEGAQRGLMAPSNGPQRPQQNGPQPGQRRDPQFPSPASTQALSTVRAAATLLTKTAAA